METFCESITFGSGEIWPDLIIYGEKTEDQDDGMEVSILSIVHGVETREKVFIRKGNGANCGENTGRFAVGEKFIFALSKVHTEEEEPLQYWLSICGVNFLKVEGTKVVGAIAPDLEEIPIDEFHTINNCGIFTPINPIFDNNIFKLFPNPASNLLRIEWEFDKRFEGHLNILDSSGRQIRKWELTKDNETKISYDVSPLPAGLYFVELYALDRREVFKIVIQR